MPHIDARKKQHMELINITLSKKKITLAIIGSLLFVVLGLLFTAFPDRFTTLLIRNVLLIRLIGIIATLFFGFVLITLTRKVFFDKNLGIIINEEGIIDNSSFVGVGLIKWEDITSIEKSKVSSTNFLLIKVKNPEHYINTPNRIKSNLLKANYKSYGTPISISSNFVRCSFAQLENIILNSFEKYRMNH